jgi:NHL repeat
MFNQSIQIGVASRVLAVAALIGALLAFGCATTTTYTIGGTVSRLQGTVVLQVNGGDNLSVSANGPFTFTAGLKSGAAYTVTVLTQPSNPGQICSVTNGSSTVAAANITTVAVTCIYTTTALVVTEDINNRVVIFNAPLATGQNGNVVLGQPNFTTATTGKTAATMNQPYTIAEDRAGNLYVADDANCRVTQFQPPFSNGMSASIVFGQPNLSSANCLTGVTATTLGNSVNIGNDEVLAVNLDSSGALWVADSGNNRVLEYIPPFTNDMAATLAIGQPDLTSGNANQSTVLNSPPTSASLYDPGLFTFDPSGNIWIPDLLNNRLLEFKAPFVTGMAATLVLGQADFTHNLRNQSSATPSPAAANTLDDALSAVFDLSGNLWVADSLNNRVLEYLPPFTSNMAASLVLGQADFTHNLVNEGLSAPTAATFNFPTQLAFDSSGRLIVADSGNNRTLVFTPPFTTGMNATLVLGQGSFTSATPATTVNGQNSPTGVSVAPPL